MLNKGLFDQRVIVIGSSDTAKEIVKEIQERKDSGYQITAAISKNAWPEEKCDESIGFICQESYENICDIAEQFNIKKIIVALKEKRGALPN